MNQRSRLRYPSRVASALPVVLLWLVSGLLPTSWASALGAGVFGAIGPRTRKHRHVRRNLSFVLPHAGNAELERAAKGVWRNLGAVIAEYPHLRRILASRVQVEMPPEVRELLASRKPFIAMSGHLANWELIAPLLTREGMPLTIVYSEHDDPVVEPLIQRFRTNRFCHYIAKEDAVRGMLRAAAEGHSLGLLPDTRVDSGIMLPLFDVAARTTLSPARLAQRLGYPILPLHVQRLPAARFRIVFERPLPPPARTAGKDAASEVMRQFNRLLEAWIRQRPDQWLCTKRRWPKLRAGAAGSPA